jgi:hypothetical protein
MPRKARFCQFHESARPMREALPLWRQAVLFLWAHLTESGVESIRAEQRIIAEPLVAARWPYRNAIDATFKILDMPIGPGQAESGNKMCVPLFGRLRTALDQ